MTGKSTAIVYADIRRAVGGIQFTIGPLPTGQPWTMRLSYETAEAFSNALITNTAWTAPLSIPDSDGIMHGIAYEPGDGGGWIIYARLNVNSGKPETLAEWGCAAGALSEIGTLLGEHAPDRLPPLAGDPAAPWQPEDFHLCTGCGRPVFDSMPTMMVARPSTGGFIGMMCEPCGIREMELVERDAP